MKQLITIIILLTSTLVSLGQSLIFDNLETTLWTSDISIIDSTNIIGNRNGFGLENLNVSKDSIKIDLTIWSFKDSLILTYYDATRREESLIGKYEYKIENNLLIISFDNNNPTEYTVGIISTGSFALLTKKKAKKNKKRKPNNG